MNLFLLLKKRNYIYFYYKLKLYFKFVKKGMFDYEDYGFLDNLIDYFRIVDFKKIVVVVSGFSVKKIVLEKDVIYFCCNDLINIVKSMFYVYVVHDLFYLMIYLKFFMLLEKWLGIVFWIMDNNFKINFNLFEKVL